VRESREENKKKNLHKIDQDSKNDSFLSRKQWNDDEELKRMNEKKTLNKNNKKNERQLLMRMMSRFMSLSLSHSLTHHKYMSNELVVGLMICDSSIC
jgi:hypothetical protein